MSKFTHHIGPVIPWKVVEAIVEQRADARARAVAQADERADVAPSGLHARIAIACLRHNAG